MENKKARRERITEAFTLAVLRNPAITNTNTVLLTDQFHPLRMARFLADHYMELEDESQGDLRNVG